MNSNISKSLLEVKLCSNLQMTVRKIILPGHHASYLIRINLLKDPNGSTILIIIALINHQNILTPK